MTSNIPKIDFNTSVLGTNYPNDSDINNYSTKWSLVAEEPCNYIDCDSSIKNIGDHIGNPCDYIDCENALNDIKDIVSETKICDVIDCDGSINSVQESISESNLISNATSQAITQVFSKKSIIYTLIGIGSIFVLILILLIIVFIKVML